MVLYSLFCEANAKRYHCNGSWAFLRSKREALVGFLSFGVPIDSSRRNRLAFGFSKVKLHPRWYSQCDIFSMMSRFASVSLKAKPLRSKKHLTLRSSMCLQWFNQLNRPLDSPTWLTLLTLLPDARRMLHWPIWFSQSDPSGLTSSLALLIGFAEKAILQLQQNWSTPSVKLKSHSDIEEPRRSWKGTAKLTLSVCFTKKGQSQRN